MSGSRHCSTIAGRSRRLVARSVTTASASIKIGTPSGKLRALGCPVGRLGGFASTFASAMGFIQTSTERVHNRVLGTSHS
jgi:hypothetical protein